MSEGANNEQKNTGTGTKLVVAAASAGASLPVFTSIPHTGLVGWAASGFVGLAIYHLAGDVHVSTSLIPGNKSKPPKNRRASLARRIFYGKSQIVEASSVGATLPPEGGQNTPGEALSKQARFIGDDPRLNLDLSPTFQPDINMVLREGMLACGIKGSGKTGVIARIIEQITSVASRVVRYGVPLVVFDKEGDLLSLLDIFPNGRVADETHWYTAKEIITKRLQVVVNLHAWLKSEDKAEVIAKLVFDLIEYTNSLPTGQCVPCPVFLDEGQFWLPQDSVSYMDKDTRLALLNAFDVLLNAGRKRGLTPFIFTQRMAQINKDVCSTGIQIFMRQVLDNDQRRCMDYIRTGVLSDKKDLASFRPGQAVVCLPMGVQLVVQFKERETKHISHAPTVDRVGDQPAEQIEPRPSSSAQRLTAETVMIWYQDGRITEEQFLLLMDKVTGRVTDELDQQGDVYGGLRLLRPPVDRAQGSNFTRNDVDANRGFPAQNTAQSPTIRAQENDLRPPVDRAQTPQMGAKPYNSPQENDLRPPVDRAQTPQNDIDRYRLTDKQAEMLLFIYPDLEPDKDKALRRVGANTSYRAHANELIEQHQLRETKKG